MAVDPETCTHSYKFFGAGIEAKCIYCDKPYKDMADKQKWGYNNTCECGSEKVGSPRHSPWCPKYVKED